MGNISDQHFQVKDTVRLEMTAEVLSSAVSELKIETQYGRQWWVSDSDVDNITLVSRPYEVGSYYMSGAYYLLRYNGDRKFTRLYDNTTWRVEDLLQPLRKVTISPSSGK